MAAACILLRHSLRMRTAVLLLLAVAVSASCGRSATSAPVAGTVSDASTGGDWFVDRAVEAGLVFTHVNGMSGARFEPEIFGPGVALFDYDNDGDLDVYAVQGQMLGAGRTFAQALTPPVDPRGVRDRLFRNDLTVTPDGRRALHFTDVTDAASIDVQSYGMGVAAGDLDNDGWIDLYLTRLGRNVLLHNNGNGTFSDVSAKSGADTEGWSIPAALVDYDRDGDLDLYVGYYLAYDTAANESCTTVTGQPDYCPPAAYRPAPDHLLRNRGDGTFEDVTARAGLAGEPRPALGVSTADFNGDGWLDIYVANDGMENALWINQRNGTFVNTALLAGVALNASGDTEASMGVDAGDFDNDGDEDLFIANWTGEGHTLYGNDGTGHFEDWGTRSGIRAASLAFTGFGAAWFDMDNDGWLDLLVANGAVRTIAALAAAGDPYPLHQTPQVFRNLGTGRFEEASGKAGAIFRRSTVGRGAAFGDIDNDGDVDVVMANNNGPLELLVNQIGQTHHWIGVRAVAGGRDVAGALVGVVGTDGRLRWRRVRHDGSYASANDPRVIVGLGQTAAVAAVRIVWTDGTTEEWTGPAVDRWSTLQKGTGRDVAVR